MSPVASGRAKSRREPIFLRLVTNLVDPETGEAKAAFVAPDEQEARVLRERKLKVGTVYRCELHKPRNHKHHRLVMATLQFLCDSCELFDTIDQALIAVKLGMGFCDPIVVVDAKGRQTTQYVMRSISFDAMPEDEFAVFHRDLVRFIVKRYLPEMTPDQINTFADLTKDTPA